MLLGVAVVAALVPLAVEPRTHLIESATRAAKLGFPQVHDGIKIYGSKEFKQLTARAIDYLEDNAPQEYQRVRDRIAIIQEEKGEPLWFGMLLPGDTCYVGVLSLRLSDTAREALYAAALAHEGCEATLYGQGVSDPRASQPLACGKEIEVLQTFIARHPGDEALRRAAETRQAQLRQVIKDEHEKRGCPPRGLPG